MNNELRPFLYEINTRVYLNELSKNLKKQATLSDIPDSLFLNLANKGFDYIWFLGIWQIGKVGQVVSQSTKEWQLSFRKCLSDLNEKDITGSPFAIQAYNVDSLFGGDLELAKLRIRMQKFNLKLCLDFVPNHTAIDHPWVNSHPDFYIQGSEQDLLDQPQNFTKVNTNGESLILAYGRDPYFSGWPDTIQLNYFNANFQNEMLQVVKKISSQCDAVRCDMAMLVLPDVFKKTWGDRPRFQNPSFSVIPFWPVATKAIKAQNDKFIFIAEAYWDLEWQLQHQGFDFTYDKRLYDRLAHENSESVNSHLQADWDYSRKLVRFLENHDEERASDVFFMEKQRAAALITFFSPGLMFYHEGEFEGWKKHASVHLNRRPVEKTNTDLFEFYQNLLEALKKPAIKTSSYQLLFANHCHANNHSSKSFVCALRTNDSGQANLAIVNYSSNPAQCFLPIPLTNLKSKICVLTDMMSAQTYERDGDKLIGEGLFLDVPAWGYHLFEITLK